MKSRQTALMQIVQLIKTYNLSITDINQALEHHVERSQTETMTKLLAYLGGIFIFAGISIYVGTFWPKMSSPTRISIILGTGLILYILAMILPINNKKNEYLITPLFLTSIFFQTCGLFVAIYELARDIDIQLASLLIFGVMFIQQYLSFLKLHRPVLLFSSLVFGSAFLATALELLSLSDRIVGIIMGAILMGIAFLLNKSIYRTMSSFWYFVGAIIFLNGLFDLVKNTWFEILFFAAGCGLLYLSTLVRNRTLLLVSTIASLGYIGYFSYKHFINSAAWPIALVLVGFICFAAGVTVLRISKRYM